MTAPVALDLSRLALAPVRRVPRGIDRVELAYARYFLNDWPGDCLPILPTPWGVRCHERRWGLAFLSAVEALWRESVEPSQDPSLAAVKSFLAGHEPASSTGARRLRMTSLEQARGFLKLLSAAGLPLGRSVTRTLPEGSFYLNAGQLQVFRPSMTWLCRRPDVQSVFMIYDLIPLEWPEHHIDTDIRLHHAIMRNTAEFAKALIVPSETVRLSVRRELSKYPKHDLPIHVELLPVAPRFLQAAAEDYELRNSAYFVVCSAIDAYKNHLLLLEVWTKLVAIHGGNAPKLVVAGTPGVTADAVIGYYRNNPAIRGHVIMTSGLSTPALQGLMANARALLMPSLAEGFGLPVIEALSQGTQVVASDISAHREAGAGGDVIYLNPTDKEQWRACIEALAASPRRRSSGVKYRPKTWLDYFAGIRSFLSSVTEARGGAARIAG